MHNIIVREVSVSRTIRRDALPTRLLLLERNDSEIVEVQCFYNRSCIIAVEMIMKLLLLLGIVVFGSFPVSSYIVEPGPVVQASNGEVWPKPFQQDKFDAFSILSGESVTFKVKGKTCDILTAAITRYSRIIKKQLIHKRESGVHYHGYRNSSLYNGDFSSIYLNLTHVCDEKVPSDMIESCTYCICLLKWPINCTFNNNNLSLLRSLERRERFGLLGLRVNLGNVTWLGNIFAAIFQIARW